MSVKVELIKIQKTSHKSNHRNNLKKTIIIHL